MARDFDWGNELDCMAWMDAQDQLQETRALDDESEEKLISLEAEIDRAQTQYEDGQGVS